jgi:hypothetical protein
MRAEQTDLSDLDAQADEALETVRKLPPGPAPFRSNEEGPAASACGRREAGAKGLTQYRHRRMSRAFAMYASVRHYLSELEPRVGDWNIGAGSGDVGDGAGS